MMIRHVAENELALFASGDLSLTRGVSVRWHLSRCEACQSLVEGYRDDRARLRRSADELPEGLDWKALSAEMTANIHLGLEAGECVTPRPRKTPLFSPVFSPVAGMWKPAAFALGGLLVLSSAWYLNVPPADNQSLMRAFRAIARGGQERMPQNVRVMDDRTPVVEVSASGITVRENGSQLGMSQNNMRPVAVSVSAQGSASARYVDVETGQVTVTSVYVE